MKRNIRDVQCGQQLEYNKRFKEKSGKNKKPNLKRKWERIFHNLGKTAIYIFKKHGKI